MAKRIAMSNDSFLTLLMVNTFLRLRIILIRFRCVVYWFSHFDPRATKYQICIRRTNIVLLSDLTYSQTKR